MTIDTAAAGSDLLRMINRSVSLDPSIQVDMDTDLLLTGLVDSLGVIEIVTFLEKKHDVEIDVLDVVIENFQTPSRMLALVDRLRAAGDE